MGSIVYRNSFGREYALEIGQNYSVSREGNCVDICLHRAVAHDFPLSVAILIRTNGDVVLWYTEFDGNTNTYWHLTRGSETINTLTDAQRETIIKMHKGQIELPGGLGGALGRPVIALAMGEHEAKIADAYHN
jgi:hypothetical protein